MPNIDDQAKQWQTDQAGRIGEAVAALRKAQDLTVAELSDKTRELGYPIHRVAITKIETNARSGKMDLAELITLAAALHRSPIELIYPEVPDGPVMVIPRETDSSFGALQWFSGEVPVAAKGAVLNKGALLMASRHYARLRARSHLTELGMRRSSADPDRMMDAAEVTETVARLRVQLAEVRAEVLKLGGVVIEPRTTSGHEARWRQARLELISGYMDKWGMSFEELDENGRLELLKLMDAHLRAARQVFDDEFLDDEADSRDA
ncbi:helix-turn-helix domain-containing protein [Nocardia sp. alder85J]|uniref:helix-turn-helix domain-containing protein n=1 Tax=Nocardia sp. alder85J TaxID=2862949 RepID=UPI001CD2AE52|nr:helix-turn-helix transcriptional regulator [Nocardia sp. alder85J]MCX4097611.1 helix-turn-helix transcriptional regulator [Nocardia sp. alder85J]